MRTSEPSEPKAPEATRAAQALSAISHEDIRRTLQEQQVLQLELEMQNDELRRAHETLRESEASLRAFFDSPGLLRGIVEVVGDDILHINDNTVSARFFGRTVAEMRHRRASEMGVPPETRRLWIDHYQASERTGLPVSFDYCHTTGTDTRYFCVTVSHLGKGQSGPRHAYAIEDITSRKHAETELLKMQKLQSVGTLAGGIAHDFNNILLGLFGNISLAKGELPIDHPGYALLEEAEKSMNRAVRLTKQLLTFAKGGDPVKEDLHLGALVEEVARFDLSGSNVRLLFQQAEGLWPAEADKGQIQQVISNLVINARQAMPKGGCLTITLENADLPEASLSGLRQGKYIKGTVRDEGVGVDPSLLDRCERE